jgi:hypothetical protein
MSSPSNVMSRFLAVALLLALALPAVAARAEGWSNLNVRGFALRPAAVSDVVDTSVVNLFNRDQNVFLMWDRDSLMEQRADFGGYAVYRAIGRDTVNMTLLRRYVLRPSRIFGNSERNPENGSTSQLWTFRDRHLAGVGLFIDPDSIIYYDRIPKFAGLRSGIAFYDTVYERGMMPGPKNGFDYYYAVTVCDTTENGEDLTPRSSGLVGPIRPTGAAVKDNLDAVKVVPNPYTFRADWEGPGQRKIRFTNLPAQVRIEVYTTTGDLVRTLSHSSSTENGEDWDVKNGAGQEVGSGIYIFRLETPEGRSRISRFTIIR